MNLHKHGFSDAEPLFLTREKIRMLDSLAIETCKIPGIVLMENAGRKAAEVIQTLMIKNKWQRVAVVCGKGNNGGDGYVIARHLFNWGIDIRVFSLSDEQGLADDARTNLRICNAMKAPVDRVLNLTILEENLKTYDMVVDAVLGTGVEGKIRGTSEGAVRAIQNASKPVVSIDIPSGLDANTGKALGVCVRADYTLTFAAPKQGFLKEDGPNTCGEMHLIDIGIPRMLYNRE